MDELGKTERTIDQADLAQSFLNHPYWRLRISPLLSTTIQRETETVLDPTRPEQHAVARASVAVCRRILMLPHSDVQQGQVAAQAIERFEAKRGAWVAPFKARNSAEEMP